MSRAGFSEQYPPWGQAEADGAVSVVRAAATHEGWSGRMLWERRRGAVLEKLPRPSAGLLWSWSKSHHSGEGNADHRLRWGFNIAPLDFILNKWNTDIEGKCWINKPWQNLFLFSLKSQGLPSDSRLISFWPCWITLLTSQQCRARCNRINTLITPVHARHSPQTEESWETPQPSSFSLFLCSPFYNSVLNRAVFPQWLSESYWGGVKYWRETKWLEVCALEHSQCHL